MIQKYGYIYQVTNTINGKKYIGKRVRSRFDEKYYGSGKLIKLSIEKYGKQAFSRKILKWCYSKLELEQSEIRFIETIKPEYNLTRGGTGGATKGFFGKHHSLNSRKKISESGIGRIPPNKGKQISEETRNKIREKRQFQVITESHKANISNGLKKAYFLKTRIPSMLGKKQTLESNLKRSKTLIGIKRGPQSDEHKKKTIEANRKGLHIRWHKNRNIVVNECKYCKGQR